MTNIELNDEEFEALKLILRAFIYNQDNPFYKGSLQDKETFIPVFENMKPKINLLKNEFNALKNILEFFIYQSFPFYKGSLKQVAHCKNILFKKMKVKEWCLIREAYIEH